MRKCLLLEPRPEQVTIYLNLNAAELDFTKIKLPDWPPSAANDRLIQ